MSYWHVKRTAEAKAYTDEVEARQRAEQRKTNPRVERAIAWIAQYRANPRPSRFNWAPRFAPTPPKDIDQNGEQIIEGEFTELADAGTKGGREHQPDRGEEPARASGEAATVGALGGEGQGKRPTRRGVT